MSASAHGVILSEAKDLLVVPSAAKDLVILSEARDMLLPGRNHGRSPNRKLMPDKILIASDHAGFQLKEKLERALGALGYDVEDLGTNSSESADYADYAHPLAQKVSDGEVKRGVLLCGTGLGMSYTANRYPRVRAAVAWNPEIAKLAREHNDANVLVVPARFVSEEEGVRILTTWLDTPFEGGRHARRVDKIETKETR